MPAETVKRIREEYQFTATILAFALIPLSGFAVDIYLPSMPQMGQSLHASSIQVQSTITIFLVSYGISQLFIGSLLDSFGRYHIGLWALIVFAISCLVIATIAEYLCFLRDEDCPWHYSGSDHRSQKGLFCRYVFRRSIKKLPEHVYDRVVDRTHTCAFFWRLP